MNVQNANTDIKSPHTTVGNTPAELLAAPKNARKVNRIQELDALRGIASLSVVLFHFTMFRPQAAYSFNFGVTGVDLFFMISGYVIFLTINRVSNWRDFIVSRIARLYPAYWTAVIITSGLIYFFYPQHFYPQSVVANATMFQNFLGAGDLDGAYWTLAVELLFYGLILLLHVTNQLQATERWGMRLMAFLLIFHVFGTLYLGEVYETIKDYFPLVNHAPLFFSGILFYNLQHKKPNKLRHLAITACFIFACYLHSEGGTARGSITAEEHYIILLIYVGVFYLFINNKLSFLVNRYTVFLGTVSYSLYLIHYTLSVKVIIPYLETNGWDFVSASLVGLLAAFGVASAITFLIERPANNAIRTYYKRVAARQLYPDLLLQTHAPSPSQTDQIQ